MKFDLKNIVFGSTLKKFSSIKSFVPCARIDAKDYGT